MHILFCTYGTPEKTASTRARVTQFLDYLSDQGIGYDLLLPPQYHSSPAIYYYRLFKKAAHADLIFIQKRCDRIFWIKLLAGLRKPIVFELDDAIFEKVFWGEKKWARRLRQFHFLLNKCTHVIAGNQFLADYVKSHNPHVSEIPVSIRLDRFCFVPRDYHDRKLVIGWSGTGRNHVENLVKIKDALQKLDRDFEVRFKIIGAQKVERIHELFSEMREAQVLDWVAPEKICEEMAEFDIGLMPLTNTEFNKGKCGLKALEYMSIGTVPVVSPLGVNCQIVKDGENGFWADNTEEWYEKLSHLIRNPAKLSRFSQSGRRHVEKNYAFEVIAKRWVNLLADIANSK